MNKHLLKGCISFLIVGISTTLLAQWKQTNGPNYSSVNCMTYYADTIFAGTPESGVYRSIDNGFSWTALTTLFNDKQVLALATAGDTVYAGLQDYGLYRSVNNGKNWTNVNTGFSIPQMRIYALLKAGPMLLAGTINGILYSSDKGVTWTQSSSLTTTVNALTTDGTNTFAATTGGMYISTDNGLNWTAVNNGISGLPAKTVAIKGTEIYAGTNTGGVFLSTDNGANWVQKRSGQCYAITTNGTQVFAAFSSGGVFVTTNSGTSWTAMNNGFNATNPYFVSMMVKGSSVFAGGFRTDDNGNFWKLTALPIASVKTLYVNGSSLLVGSTQGLSETTDQGVIWNPISPGLNNSVDAICNIGSTLFIALSSDGVYKSTDNGASWTLKSTGISNLGSMTATSLATDGTNIFLGTTTGVYLSANNGDSWTAVNNGLTNTDIKKLAILNGAVYAGSNGGGLFKSTDNGSNWTTAGTGITQTKITSLTVDGTDIYAGTQGGGAVYVSKNDGSTWTRLGAATLPTGQPINAIVVRGSNLFAATIGGVYFSSNSGTSWTAANTGLINYNISSMVADATNLYCAASEYGGVEGRGVWSRPLSDLITVTSINHAVSTNDALIYPNPISNELTVELSNLDDATLEIFNLGGDQLLTSSILTAKSVVDLSSLKNGIYIVKIKNASGMTVQKLVKQ